MSKPAVLVLLFLASLSSLFSPSFSRDNLTPAQPLTDNGETLISYGGTFALGFFSPSGSDNHRYIGIWYNNIPIQTVVWVANRQSPVIGKNGTLSISTDGVLVIFDSHSTLWNSSTTRVSKPIATILESGNFVVQDADDASSDNYAWQSFDYLTDTLLPGMKLGWNLTSGENRNQTAWKSIDDPSPGQYALGLDTHSSLPQMALLDGSTTKWKTGPYNGTIFASYGAVDFSPFIETVEYGEHSVYYSYNLTNNSVVVRMQLNQSGTIQLSVWFVDSDDWILYFYLPRLQCEGYAPCGPNGVCDPHGSSLCICPNGFEPRFGTNWALGDYSGGCIRKTALACPNGTDGFLMVSDYSIPDTTGAMVYDAVGLEECRSRCLMNCSCTAYASLYVGHNTNGCVIWVDELVNLNIFNGGGLYIRLAASEIALLSSHHVSHSTTIIYAVAIPCGILAVASACIFFWVWRKRRMHRDQSWGADEDLELPLFDFANVIMATGDFSQENKLGEGGFGPVYKGKTAEGQEIAVKRLAKTSIQGIDEFKNEIMLVAKLQHRNLVRLLGYCIHGEEKMLIYEYMPNKSLDYFLFDKQNNTPLDWKTRYQIIKSIAKGLLYLHLDSRFRIIHRDLKASNILLDKDMIPKISDFGMARIFGGDETINKTRRVVGTYGYMSPEYAMNGIFSVKSDVFSFGVLILEIVSGERNRGVYASTSNSYILGCAWKLWNEGKIKELIDPSMGESFSIVEVKRCIQVGLLCVQEFPEERPTMSAVSFMLCSGVLPEPKQPGFMTIRDNLGHSNSQNKECYSGNDITLTMPIGR